MINDSPLVSIIVPTFNRRDLLEETLDSVRAQTYPHWEAIVVDDGSSDDTLDYLQKLARVEKRIRGKPRSGEHGNASVCRNQGFAASSGDYAVFLDSDDVLSTGFLEHRVATMQRNQDLDFAVWPAYMFNDIPGDGDMIFRLDNREHPLDRFLKLDTPWQTTGVMWPRTTLEALGPWREELPSWQDWELHVRALARGLKFLWFQEPDYYFRVARPGANRVAIGAKQYNEPEHLEAAGDLLLHVEELLQQAAVFTEEKRDAIAGIYYVLAERWRKLGDVDKSRRLWQRARERELFSKLTFLFGKFFLAISTRRWKLARLRESWLWSRHLLNFGLDSES
jgi:glycosyltransferase involved in cell wall biosynthesis